MQEEHQSYKLFANILQGATNYVDALGKKSPLIGKVTDTSLQLAQPLIKQLKPVLDYSIEVADNTVDKAIDRGVTVVNRARNIRTKADKVRAEKASKFVAAACDAWSKLHANPGPVSFAELQGQLRALYTQSVESVSKPANQIWRVARESNGDSLVVRVRKVWDETHTVLIERVEFAVIFAERAVDTYLPPPMPLTDVAEPQDLSVQQHTKPLVVRVMQLPVTVTRRVGSKAMQQIDFSKVKLRTREAVDSFVHIDLMAYASGQTDAIRAYAKCQAANMTNALALAKERAVNSYTHARAHLEQIAAVVPRPQELQQRLMDPERREQLRQALKQMIENLRVKAEESRVYGVLYGKKAAKFLLVHCSDILQVTMKKLPDEAKQALFNTIKQAEMCVRYMLGDKATEQAVAYATQLLVSAWVFADMRADEPQGGAAPAPARAQETQEAEETATPRQSKKKGGKKQQ